MLLLARIDDTVVVVEYFVWMLQLMLLTCVRLALENAEVVDILLEYGVQVDLKSTVSYIKESFHDWFFGITLIRLSVSVEPCQNGNTALMWAAKEGHAAAVNVLLEHDAQMDLLNDVSTLDVLAFRHRN